MYGYFSLVYFLDTLSMGGSAVTHLCQLHCRTALMLRWMLTSGMFTWQLVGAVHLCADVSVVGICTAAVHGVVQVAGVVLC